ncbi:MAG: GNAT family N-acetyltransferase [Paracoccus sp. (in: a-proteobacteria)]|nr:GNAT family N-acetyltransferase [Paracoccus sp. (in: a-proteobacteria)]
MPPLASPTVAAKPVLHPDAQTGAVLAALHARCFHVPRPWSADEFDDMLGQPGTFLLHASGAFLLGRALAGEAELLTLAVAPEQRRRGTGRALLARFAQTAWDRGAASAFLEVGAGNVAARALYLGAGWVEAGRRPRYYGPDEDAIVMRLIRGGASSDQSQQGS